MIESVRTGTKPLITPEHAYHVLEIMTAAMRAGDTGQAQEIRSSFTPARFDDAPLLGGAESHLAHDSGRAG